MLLGVIALRVEGKLEWDAAKMRFTNNSQANKYSEADVPQGLVALLSVSVKALPTGMSWFCPHAMAGSAISHTFLPRIRRVRSVRDKSDLLTRAEPYFTLAVFGCRMHAAPASPIRTPW